MKLAKREPVSRKDFNTLMNQPPISLREVRHSLVEGVENVWYEYVPASYTGEEPVPLVIHNHGGGWGGDGCAQANYDHYTAQREGFIVVFPNSMNFERWLCTPDDFVFLSRLIEYLGETYNIDKSRVYMQGKSNGDMITLAFSLNHPELLAAGGYITGALPDSMVKYAVSGPLPVAQFRGEKDIDFPHMEIIQETPYAIKEAANDHNRRLWMEVNEVDPIPALRLRGKDNFVMYSGGKADILYWEVKDMGHLQPAYLMQVFWDYIYSGYRRVNGEIVRTVPKRAFECDRDAFALAVGSNQLFLGDHLERIDNGSSSWVMHVYPSNTLAPGVPDIGEMRNLDAIYAPIGVLEKGFGAQVEVIDAGGRALAVLPGGGTLEFLDRSLLVYRDGEVHALNKPSMYIGGTFYIPIRDVAAELFNRFVSILDDVLYISPHYIELTRGTARILREIFEL